MGEAAQGKPGWTLWDLSNPSQDLSVERYGPENSPS